MRHYCVVVCQTRARYTLSLSKKAKGLNMDTIVVGYNAGWKQKLKNGKKINQNFAYIPFSKIISAIENKCLKRMFKKHPVL